MTWARALWNGARVRAVEMGGQAPERGTELERSNQYYENAATQLTSLAYSLTCTSVAEEELRDIGGDESLVEWIAYQMRRISSHPEPQPDEGLGARLFGAELDVALDAPLAAAWDSDLGSGVLTAIRLRASNTIGTYSDLWDRSVRLPPLEYSNPTPDATSLACGFFATQEAPRLEGKAFRVETRGILLAPDGQNPALQFTTARDNCLTLTTAIPDGTRSATVELQHMRSTREPLPYRGRTAMELRVPSTSFRIAHEPAASLRFQDVEHDRRLLRFEIPGDAIPLAPELTIEIRMVDAESLYWLHSVRARVRRAPRRSVAAVSGRGDRPEAVDGRCAVFSNTPRRLSRSKWTPGARPATRFVRTPPRRSTRCMARH